MVRYAIAAITLVSLAASASAAELWHALQVPGARADLCEAAGLDPDTDEALLWLELVRKIHRSPDPSAPLLESVAQYLRAHRDASARFAIPLPLGPERWRTLLNRPVAAEDLFFEILKDRRASLLYHGLAALDDDTLAFLAGQAGLLRLIYEKHAAVFGAFGRSIHVSGGRLVLPGHPAAAGAWERLADRPAADPAAFIDALLGRDAGRLAYLFDTVAHLDPPRAAFVLSDLEGVYEIVTGGDRRWDLVVRPLSRPSLDPAWMLHLVDVDGDGRLRGPRSMAFWEAAFGGGDRPGTLEREPDVTARWLLSRIVAARVAERLERFTQFRFAQRVFPDLPPASASDALAAVRGFARYPALMLTLERMGLRNAALYAEAARHAQSLSRGRSVAALTQFQSAVAILERARFARVLSVADCERLAGALLDLPFEDGRYGGGLAEWLATQIDRLPARSSLRPSPFTDAPLESRLLDALAGIGSRHEPAVAPLQWEGLRYRVDVAAAERLRLDRIRRRQGGPTLDAALAEVRRARADRGRSAVSTVEDADLAVAHVLASIVYAAHLGDPDGPVATSENAARRHDFGVRTSPPPRVPTEWSLPVELAGGGAAWHVRGSLLGLDLALANLWARRLATDHPPRVPTLSLGDRQAFVRTAVLTSAFALDDADRDRLAAAMDRGRSRLAATARDPAALAAVLSASGVGEWRCRAVLWRAARRENLVDLVSLTELARMGLEAIRRETEAGHGEAEIALDSWGAPAFPLDGALSLRFPDARAWEEFAWRPAGGQLAARTVELQLRVAQALAALRLPAALVPAVLTRAAIEFADQIQPAHENDGFAAARQARRLTRERIEDYIASLAAGGPLMADPSQGSR